MCGITRKGKYLGEEGCSGILPAGFTNRIITISLYSSSFSHFFRIPTRNRQSSTPCLEQDPENQSCECVTCILSSH